MKPTGSDDSEEDFDFGEYFTDGSLGDLKRKI